MPGEDARGDEGARRSATGLPIVAPPRATAGADADAGAGVRGGEGRPPRPPLGTVMLAVALGEILAAIFAVASIVGLAALKVSEGVAVAAASGGYVVLVAIWTWAAHGMLRALSGWEPGRAATFCAVAIGAAVGGALALALNYALRDAPLAVSGTLASASYVLVPAVLLDRLAPAPSRWAIAAAVALAVLGAAALGLVVADELG